MIVRYYLRTIDLAQASQISAQQEARGAYQDKLGVHRSSGVISALCKDLRRNNFDILHHMVA